VLQQGTAAGVSKPNQSSKSEEQHESDLVLYREEAASPCCAQSLEVAMILSNLHSGEQFEPKMSPPKATRITGGSGDYDEDWYEDSSCDLHASKSIGDSLDNRHYLVPQSTSPPRSKLPKLNPIAVTAQQMMPLRDLQGIDDDDDEGAGQRKSSVRTGKWSIEEEQFARALVSHFRSGSLNIPPGTTLRSYLAEKLDCVSTKSC